MLLAHTKNFPFQWNFVLLILDHVLTRLLNCKTVKVESSKIMKKYKKFITKKVNLDSEKLKDVVFRAPHPFSEAAPLYIFSNTAVFILKSSTNKCNLHDRIQTHAT